MSLAAFKVAQHLLLGSWWWAKSQLLKLHNICYWDHGGWQSLSESISAVILRVAPKCRSELSSCLPMWHPPILGNLLISQQMLKSELRTNNKIRVCNKNDKSVKMLIMWCFRWGKFVYPSSAVPPTDEDLIAEDEEQVISTHMYNEIRFWQVLLYHLHLRLAPTHPLSWAPSLEVVSLSELPLLSSSAASSIEKAEGSHLLSAHPPMSSICSQLGPC